MKFNSLQSQGRRALALLAMVASAASHAQFDPTRPHPAWVAAQAPIGTQSAAREPINQVPQIIVMGPSRKFAIVDGQSVQPGETYNGAKLLGIDGGDVVWQRGGGQEKSSMSPGVEKAAPGKGSRERQLVNVRKKILNGEAK